MLFSRRVSGQAIIPGIALLALAGIILFLVFNSTRAVNEKINLVNAADASAYSGAQVVARQLNFMAYTNRVMIANEVAIGHMVSYQAEVDTLSNSFANMGGIFGTLVKSLLNLTFSVGGNQVKITTQSAANWFKAQTRAYTGLYVLGVSANNAVYAEFMKDEYDALLGLNNQTAIVDDVMQAVAQQYIKRPGIQIDLNSPQGMAALQNSPDPKLQQLAQANNGYRNGLCHMIAFARPGNNSTLDNTPDANAVDEYCADMLAGKVSGMVGGRDNPYDDAGVMLDLIQRSSKAVSSSQWINQRDMNYNWGLGWNAQRQGSTQLVWQGNGYRWRAESDSLSVKSGLLGLLFSMHGGSDANNNSYDLAKAGQFGVLQKSLMKSTSMCVDVDCSKLAANQSALGHQMIPSYTRFNQGAGNELKVTAVLTQNTNCNDDWGVDANGNNLAGFLQDQPRFKQPCNQLQVGNARTITAAGSARVFYKNPQSPNETPNLFNPFWQASLTY